MGAFSLMIDGEPIYIDAARLTIDGNFASITIPATPPLIAAMRRAQRIGVGAQMTREAPIFLGFNDMATDGLHEKLDGILGMCSRQVGTARQ
jgi:hypothetical protein